MSFAITSWLRAYFALQQHATDQRGCVEITNDDDEVIRWPRTSACDVIAILTVFSPYPSDQPAWPAVESSCEEYADNRTFWRALLARCVYLHAQHTPLPSIETWRALFAQLNHHKE